MRSGVRHNPRRIDQSIVATTTTMPSPSTNTGSDVSARQPPQDSTTSPGWSATHAAPAAAAAIRARNRMMRIMKFLLGCRERGHGIGGEFARGGERRIAGIGLLDPALRGGTIGRRKRIELAARFIEIVAQRRRGDARYDAGAIGAGGIRALDAHELCGTGLQAIDNAAAGSLG